MKSKHLIYILLIGLTFMPLCGCVTNDEGGDAQEGTPGETQTLLLPKESLPEGITFMGEINGSTKGADINDEIEEFEAPDDIGQVEAAVGIYQFGPVGQGDRYKITLIEALDEDHAKVALDNFMSQEEFQRPPRQDVPRFGTALVNGHEVVEIRDWMENDNSIRYLLLWNHENLVVLTEGWSNDRAKTIELASATGL